MPSEFRLLAFRVWVFFYAWVGLLALQGSFGLRNRYAPVLPQV